MGPISAMSENTCLPPDPQDSAHHPQILLGSPGLYFGVKGFWHVTGLLCGGELLDLFCHFLEWGTVGGNIRPTFQHQQVTTIQEQKSSFPQSWLSIIHKAITIYSLVHAVDLFIQLKEANLWINSCKISCNCNFWLTKFYAPPFHHFLILILVSFGKNSFY